MNIYRDKKLGIIGAGVSGQGLALLARRLKAKVFVSEQKEIPDDVKKIFEKNKTEKAFIDSSYYIEISSWKI